MTKLNPTALALVDVASREWQRHKAYIGGLEARIRARVAAELEEEEQRSALKVSAALRAALDGGSTKAALRNVTTKDQRTFEAYLALLEPAEEQVTEEPPAAIGLEVDWLREDVLTITLDPRTVRAPSADVDDAKAWSGTFEVYVRPTDGKVFIDPTGEDGFGVGIGVTDWLRDDEANLARVVSWIDENPRA